MDALFACARCHSRHPFEELSSGEQLCKVCRNNHPTVKCTYCRSEFQQDETSRSICKKCYQNVKTYGKPSSCEYCSVTAAFIGKRCQRCANSEKKWGPPVPCEQCKQQCAFERDDASRRKVDGKLLCWLCTMSYKRVIAKARKRDGIPVPFQSSGDETGGKDRDRHRKDDKGKHRSAPDSHHRHNGSRDRHKDRKKERASNTHSDDGTQSGSSAKKSRFDKIGANGMVTASPLGSKQTSDTSIFDPLASTENLVLITQLKDEVESLKKQLSIKEQQLLEKEKNLTQLKAENFESEKDLRKKTESLQKTHQETIEQLKSRNRDLQKQVASLTKEAKLSKKGSSANLAALVSSTSDTNSPSS